MRAPSTLTHVFRIATLVVPTAGAWFVAIDVPHRDELTRAVAQVLGPVWIVLGSAVVLRAAALIVARRRDPSVDVLARLDVLSGSGAVLAWLSAMSIVGAVTIGWASLAAVGMLGGALFHLVVLYAFLALYRGDPLGGGTLTRTFSSATASEGDDLTEEITVENPKIPLGYRLFMTGRVGPRWATSRHVLDGAESGADVVLESEIGPAVRGEHEVEPLELWLEDTFGLTRSTVKLVAGSKLTVLPKVRAVDRNIVPLLAQGLGPRVAKTTNRLPTEGNLDLREYRDGDDVRRIHWIRSLAANQLVVRLPDEIPPDWPKVRIILDTFFPQAFAFQSDTPAEFLDAMVAVWLGVGRAFAEKGTQVRLVTATLQNGVIAPKRLDLSARAPAAALALGASVGWQGQLQVQDLWTDEPTLIVSHGVHTLPPDDPKFRWIVVVPSELSIPRRTVPSAIRTPFPLGHRENRMSTRSRQVRELVIARRDQERALREMHTHVAPAPFGSFVAVALEDSIRLEAMK